MSEMRCAGNEVAAAAREARARGFRYDGPEASAIVERYVRAIAAASGHAPDEVMRRGMRERFERHDPRASRYWELIATLNGAPAVATTVDDWNWVKSAVSHHLR